MKSKNVIMNIMALGVVCDGIRTFYITNNILITIGNVLVGILLSYCAYNLLVNYFQLKVKDDK